MSLSDLTPEAVRQAIAEFDRVGRESFLSTYGFGKARGYFLVHNGQLYDSKAIAGVAHHYLPGRLPLTSEEFSGGENATAGRFRELGFEIKGPEEQLASVPTFEPGGIYNRVRHIHDVYGGQRQGGISTPRTAPLIFLFTEAAPDYWRLMPAARRICQPFVDPLLPGLIGMAVPRVVPQPCDFNKLQCQTTLTAIMGAKGIFLRCQTG